MTYKLGSVQCAERVIQPTVLKTFSVRKLQVLLGKRDGGTVWREGEDKLILW